MTAAAIFTAALAVLSYAPKPHVAAEDAQLIVGFLVLLGVIISSVAPLWIGQRRQFLDARETKARVQRIDSQTSNSHTTNLRDDMTETKERVAKLDGRLDAIELALGRLSAQITSALKP